MTEANTDNKVETPIAQPTVEVTQVTQTPQAENETDRNWREFRQKREEERKAKEAAEKYARQKEEETEALKRAMEALVNKPTQTYQNDPVDLTQEQIIEKRVEEAISKREKIYHEQRYAKEQAELPQRLVSNFSDFNEICTSENLDYLEYHYPEVASPYKHLPEGYEKWSGLYKALKRFIPNKNAVKDNKKMEQNLSKPQAMSKPGMTQTGDHAPILALDAKRREQNWERMQKIMGKG